MHREYRLGKQKRSLTRVVPLEPADRRAHYPNVADKFKQQEREWNLEHEDAIKYRFCVIC